MKFLVQGYDGTDAKAYERRADAREQHLENLKKSQQSGKILFAAAMLNQESKMCGSTLIMEFENREELDSWLEKEPYVLGKVWEKIEITECKVPPSFLN